MPLGAVTKDLLQCVERDPVCVEVHGTLKRNNKKNNKKPPEFSTEGKESPKESAIQTLQLSEDKLHQIIKLVEEAKKSDTKKIKVWKLQNYS